MPCHMSSSVGREAFADSQVHLLEYGTGGGGNLVWEETCLEKFRTANSGAIFPIAFHDCGGIFPIFFFGHQVQNLYPVLGGGMIGGGGGRIRYVTWMDGQGSILQGTSGCLPHVVAS